MAKAIVGIAKSFAHAESIVTRIENAGVPVEDISVLMPDSGQQRDVGHVKATKAPEGATTGAVAGGVTGGVLGLLAGLGTLAIPGLGPFIAAGPIMASLGGLAAGATAGGVVGALVGLGIPEYEAKVYEDKLKQGNFLIAVHNVEGDKADEVKDILNAEDAEDVATVGEKHAR